MRENVILVDENDRETGLAEKLEAHRRGLLHRAFSVILFNDKHEMLLQKRAHGKYHSPGLWSNTCCSHPRPGEDVHAAAQRRLMEEMGITCTMKNIFSFIYHADMGQGLFEHEYDHVFLGYFSGTPQINAAEVADWAYVSQSIMDHDIAAHPQRYTYWFKILYKKLSVMGINRFLLT